MANRKQPCTWVLWIASLQALDQNDLTQGAEAGAAKVLRHVHHLHGHVRPRPTIQPVLVDVVHKRAHRLLQAKSSRLECIMPVFHAAMPFGLLAFTTIIPLQPATASHLPTQIPQKKTLSCEWLL